MNIKERIAQIESEKDYPKWHILHQLLELVMNITGMGSIGDDYTKFIEFPICDVTIFSDHYYGNVKIDEVKIDNSELNKLIT